MKKLTKSEAGKLGANATYKERYDVIKELSKYCNKELQNKLLSWKTEHLLELLKFASKSK